MHEEFVDDGVANGIRGLKRRKIGAVGADALARQAVGGAHALRLLIEVADSAQYEDAVVVGASCCGQIFER